MDEAAAVAKVLKLDGQDAGRVLASRKERRKHEKGKSAHALPYQPISRASMQPFGVPA
ncbi:MAG: hypothetical protein AVDCRST_MAG44-235 [uncultured Sphingomonas sp.]|uniref:Uncharacterized protein n=1 Tax=uncultured Sphingomonas sp. TaxID=158754 RepID=A0A6J4SC06_9SPHN|nr:MAG: hypothetical protein AVDCRST_MAG44-235 [uncultured Sphingomonas sp.]